MEGLKASVGAILRDLVRQLCMAVRTLVASTLPSSTPHWSKLLMPHMKPCKHPQWVRGTPAGVNLEPCGTAPGCYLMPTIIACNHKEKHMTECSKDI